MSENLEAVREICAEISKRVDRAYVAAKGQKDEPAEKLWNLWVNTGLLGLTLDEEYGGIGGDLTDLVHAFDWLGRDGLTHGSAVPNFMARIPIGKHGTPAQREKFLPATADGSAVFSFAITEPDAGTNTFKIRTQAIEQPDGTYLLNGSKVYITQYLESTHCLVVARTEPYDPARKTEGLSLFIMDPHAEGSSATKMNIGLLSAENNYVVSFDNVVLPADSVLGEKGNGLGTLFDSLTPERLIIAATNVGLADHILARGAAYASERAPFDKPIGSYQAVQHPMAVAKINIEAARALLRRAAANFDAGQPVGLDASMAKYLSSVAFRQAADATATAFGGAFVDNDSDIITFLLQAKLSEVAPVNNNIILSQIAQKALGLPRSY